VLAGDGRQSTPDDGDGRREERERTTVDDDVQQAVHSTPSSLAEDTQVMHDVVFTGSKAFSGVCVCESFVSTGCMYHEYDR